MWYNFALHAQVMRLLLLLDDKKLDLGNDNHLKVLNMLQVNFNNIVIASPHNIAWMTMQMTANVMENEK